MSSSVESAVKSRFTEIDRTRASKLCVESLAVVQHGGTVKVFDSILDPDIYDPAVINAFVRAKTVQGASSIQVVAGPFVITDESGHNPVVDTLAVAQGDRKKPVVNKAHFRLTQGHIEDFMVIANPDGSLHWHSEFSYSLLPRLSYIAAEIARNSEKICRQAEQDGQIFDAAVSLIRRKPQDTIGLPLRITRANLDQLVYIVEEERNRYLEDLDPEQLLGLPGARQLFLSPTFPSYLAP